MGKKAVVYMAGREDGRRRFLAKLAESGLTERDADALGAKLVRTADVVSRAPGLTAYTEFSIDLPYFDPSGAPVIIDGTEIAYFRLRRQGKLIGFSASMDEKEIRKYQNPADTRPYAYFPRGLSSRSGPPCSPTRRSRSSSWRAN